MQGDIQIRVATSEDAVAIAAIYGHNVLASTASFEFEPPDVNEMLRRRAALVELGLPYLVAEIGTHFAGYAYASPFRPRPGYRYTVENSVYVAESFQRRGVGRMLMQELISRCSRLGLREMIAVVGDPSANQISVALHRSLGFREVGVLRAVGEKFGKVLDVMLLQKPLA
jgi:L-amino acid N-acyltransferase YncA